MLARSVAIPTSILVSVYMYSGLSHVEDRVPPHRRDFTTWRPSLSFPVRPNLSGPLDLEGALFWF